MTARTRAAGILIAIVLTLMLTCASSECLAAGRGQPTDWSRFYYYPYLYYPHNFQRPQQSFDHLYYRYPPSRQIPVFNKSWYNFYPTEKPYHSGHHFVLDVF